MSTFTKNRLRGSVAAACLTALIGPGSADASASSPLPISAAPFELGQPSILKSLPAGRDDLTFRGESTRRRFAIHLTRDEPDAIKLFQLAFKNTVTALPERSSLEVIVNGQLLSVVPVNAANAQAVLPVAIPNGTLRPGLNTVELHVTMTHRVDCSLPATYELWTSVDPATTGFVVPAQARVAVRSVEDVAAEPLAQDGTTRIHLRTNGASDASAIDRAGRFIGALVARAGLERPVVETGPGAGDGPGIDVMIGTGQKGPDDMVADMRLVGQDEGVTFARDPATQRLVVMLSGVDGADVDAKLAAFTAGASQAAALVPATRIDGETRRTFADLGVPADRFAGRHYATTLGLDLPADFYPADYAKARVLIDGAYATDLDPSSGLVFRVNGAIAASLPFAPNRDGILQKEAVELPLRFFRPGHNEIAIDGTMTASADRLCEPLANTGSPRFSLSNTSELLIPRFAHLGTAPQIAGALASGHEHPVGPLYLADGQDGSVAAGLTVLANLAAQNYQAPTPAIRIGAPGATDSPGIVVAPWSALPPALTVPLLGRIAGAEGVREPATPDEEAATGFLQQGAARFRQAVAFGQSLADRWVDLDAVREGGQRLLSRQGFAFGHDARDNTVSFTPRSLLVEAVETRLRSNRIAGLEVPLFVADQRQWLVITAPDTAVLGRGLERLVADGHWASLQGEAASLDVDKGTVSAVRPDRVLYVLPSQLVAADIGPILGGLITTNIGTSLAALVALMVLLGLSTHVIIRKAGAK